MSDTASRVDAGRRAYARRHGHPTTREYRPDEVAADSIERGKAEWAARSGNRSARDALANDDQRRDH
jgi:microcompartment protein CcmK/EutM